ncbi:MAG: F-type H+-transporting ATPase subunit epsilon [Bacteroidia bacterium]|jgi:F-type H+-transporting ATPase subunit epsilon
MFLEIITPDDRLFEGEVDSATFPGSDGTFQVLNDHAPLVSSLGLGELKYQYKVKEHLKEEDLKINGGVVEVLNNRVLVLIESLQG